MLDAGQQHRCHIPGCGVRVKPEMLLCAFHWAKVPKPLKQAVWKTYRPGQCSDKNPSRAWLDAADAAIRYVIGRCGT